MTGVPQYSAIHLDQIIQQCLPVSQNGKIATYIPALADSSKSELGIAIRDLDGKSIGSGLWKRQFTMQSIAKVVTLLLALEEAGPEKVFKVVGVEPSGDPFNSIAKLEYSSFTKPFNPFINAGAIAVCNLIAGRTLEERIEKILNFARKISGNPLLNIDQKAFLSERNTGHKNRSLGHFLKSGGLLQGSVEETLDIYFHQCAILVDCEDLANIGAVLANKGQVPETGEKIVQPDYCRMVTALMVTCGLYNGSGEFAMNVGLPAKSGVSGGILVSVPGKCGIGVFGPSLDEKGNSMAGVRLLEEMSKSFSLHLL